MCFVIPATERESPCVILSEVEGFRAFSDHFRIRLVGEPRNLAKLLDCPRTFAFQIRQKIVPNLVACEFYIRIAFVFAPASTILASIGEEVFASDVQEWTIDVNAGNVMPDLISLIT